METKYVLIEMSQFIKNTGLSRKQILLVALAGLFVQTFYTIIIWHAVQMIMK
jgi:hypothetical protein